MSDYRYRVKVSPHGNHWVATAERGQATENPDYTYWTSHWGGPWGIEPVIVTSRNRLKAIRLAVKAIQADQLDQIIGRIVGQDEIVVEL